MTSARTTHAQMDSLIDAHDRAEEAADIQAIVDGFTDDAEHDVAGRPGAPLHASGESAWFDVGAIQQQLAA